MFDEMLIEHCAPTLSSLKTANMFNYKFASCGKLDEVLQIWNETLNPKGVSLHILFRHTNRALIYVCRNSMLAEDLQNRDVQDMLMQCGYLEFSPEYCIEKLKERFIDSTQFPHEIGLFLGYPLEDVIGFIENSGQNYLCTGCWKVYCNEFEAVKLFQKYKKCKDVYTGLFKRREKSVFQLTVAA